PSDSSYSGCELVQIEGLLHPSAPGPRIVARRCLDVQVSHAGPGAPFTKPTPLSLGERRRADHVGHGARHRVGLALEADDHALTGLLADLHEDAGRGGDTEQILSTAHRVTDDTLRGADEVPGHALHSVDHTSDEVHARASEKAAQVAEPGLDLPGERTDVPKQRSDLADHAADQSLERADRDLLRSVEARLDGAADRVDP